MNPRVVRAMSIKPDLSRLEQTGRRLVQLGFLGLFLLPLAISLYQNLSSQPAPAFVSWLLPWDPAVLIGQVIRGQWTAVVVGGPLLLLALSFLFGRFFCGWVCPLGTLLDLLRPLAFWQKRKSLRMRGGLFPPQRNSRLRYYVLAAALGASLLSLKYLGLLDPLVIFNRASTAITMNAFWSQQPGLRATITLVSLIFLAILALEMWQPRFWCRNLCPLGALISLVSRFSLLRRRVSPALCSHCDNCRRECPTNAIPQDATRTNYADCTFCLACARACPKDGITFGFGELSPTGFGELSPTGFGELSPTGFGELSPASLAGQRAGVSAGVIREDKGGSGVGRREFLGLLAAGAAGAAITPLVELAPGRPVLRPPGALPPGEFERACILCQECVRICPTHALRPALLEGGLAAMGTPLLVPRQGGCSLNPSCPHLCASVCPVGAILPTSKQDMKIGIAVVHRDACLAWDQGAKCLVCVEACLNEAAIAYHGRITVDPARCTGCGRCESGCPVPGSAIHVVPLADAVRRANLG